MLRCKGKALAKDGDLWKYHRKEEPGQIIRLLTDRGDLSYGDLAILLTRASTAPVDKYFALARRRVKVFDRGSRPASGEAAWYVNACYDPGMVDQVAAILRFYYNYMLPKSEDSGKKKADRQTPAMKIGTAKGLVYIGDVLSFSRDIIAEKGCRALAHMLCSFRNGRTNAYRRRIGWRLSDPCAYVGNHSNDANQCP